MKRYHLLAPLWAALLAPSITLATDLTTLSPRSVIKTIQKDGSVAYTDFASTGAGPVREQSELRRGWVTPSTDPVAKTATNTRGEPQTTKKDTGGTATDGAATDDREQKRQVCSRLKENLSALNVGRVLRLSEKGERYYLTGAQISREKAETIKSITSVCQ